MLFYLSPRFLLPIFTLSLALCFGCSKSETHTKEAKRPNIIFVMTDDHTHQQMSLTGNSFVQTPNLDRLAAEGVWFKNAFCTNSLCAPARATILTGCLSNMNGIMGNSESKDKIERLDPDLPTFPLLLKAAGYQTGIVGKWHLPHDPRGFDYSCILPGQGLYFDPEMIENGERKNFKGYVTDIITDKALEYLKGLDGDDPFCLIYQHKGPHRPFTPAPRHEDLLSEDLPHPETFNDDYATRLVAGKAADMKFEQSIARDYGDVFGDMTEAEKKEWIFQRFVKDHNRAVVSIDEGLGRVLDYLDDNGLTENTLVIYTTDNGFYLGEYGWYDKRFMYEPSLRIPFLMRYPAKVKAGQEEERMIMNVDVAPTILDFAGIDVPEVMQGESLKPLVLDQEFDWRDHVYYSYYENTWAMSGFSQADLSDPSFNFFTAHRVGPHRGIRNDRYKLIEYYSENEYWEFFDLQEDPHELRNAYDDPQYAMQIAQMTGQLRQTQTMYQDVGTWENLSLPNYTD
ncbi:sulfatase [Opitutia bacterium ISCC 51]|nr:sulfatase [Opitutae bacterium ISCC 51]QXD30186.1 sulfatase [Opitutae bacterium ISCC 52]